MLPGTTTLSLLLLATLASAKSSPRRLNHDIHEGNLPRQPHLIREPGPTRTYSARAYSHNRRTAGAPVTPSDWPTTTQPAATPSITVASAADPYLLSLSYALNNQNNALWTTQYTGDLTYYATGSVSCGDVYTDSTYTAAISHLMYDAWPGYTANTNREFLRIQNQLDV